jgi:hypothetical protein
MIARTRVLVSPLVDKPSSAADPIDPAPIDPAPIDPAPIDAVPDAPAPEATAAPVDSPPKRGRGRPKGSTARTTRTVELTLTVSGTADGEWQADLKQGTAWVTRALPVTAAAVLRAAQELHEQLAEPIDAVIGAAREQRAARVAALEAELEQARKALAEMDD